MKTVKQTAANNALLAYTKKLYNKPTYSTAIGLMNSAGQDATIAFLATYTREDLRAARVTDLRAIANCGITEAVYLAQVWPSLRVQTVNAL